MTENNRRTRNVYSHPLAAIGGALIIAGGFLFAILFLLDITSATENPYRAIATFILTPVIAMFGVFLFGISAWLQLRSARKRGERVRLGLHIDMSDPVYVRNLWLFLGSCAVLLLLVGYGGTRAFETTESVAFCGETCHQVMAPQYVTYHNSPHAKVKCVDCHIGPGATFWVKSKIDGIRQIFAVAFDSFDRPIPTPVHTLRPAQETCEGCHWPQQFYGSKLVSRTYYRSDEANSPHSINLLVKIGGDNPRLPDQGGVHWHMLSENAVEYETADPSRQVINWVKTTTRDGKVKLFRNENAEQAFSDDAHPPEVRRFDCMDCHNRPSHTFLPPAVALNLVLRADQISRRLPYVRKVGLELLNADYTDRKAANQMIQSGLMDFYQRNYPDLAKSMSDEIAKATESLIEIYNRNFFPDMKTDYRARINNLSHFVNNGCFRCHNESMATEDGEHLRYDCKTCHLIIAQGPSESVADLDSDLAGLEFEHPEDIDEMWREVPCTECHTPEEGY